MECLLYLLRLAAKLGPGCRFNQPRRRRRRSTRYSRNNLGVAARNFAAVTERIQQTLLLPHIGSTVLLGAAFVWGVYSSTEVEQCLCSSLYLCKRSVKHYCSKTYHFTCISTSPSYFYQPNNAHLFAQLAMSPCSSYFCLHIFHLCTVEIPSGLSLGAVC